MTSSSAFDAVCVDVDQLGLIAAEWDAAVDKTPDADPFCASTLWAFSAASSFPDVDPPTVVTDGYSFAGLRPTVGEDGTRILVGLDPIWGFATPILGHPLRAAQLLEARLGLDDHDVAVIVGQHEQSALTAGLVQVLGERRSLLRGPSEQRLRADLRDGVDAWFGRRSSRFRQRLRQIDRRAAAEGVSVLDCSALPPDAAMDRILAIEARSWKGHEETGLASVPLADFYRQMLWRLAAGDQLRLLVAVRDDQDLGFILGGVRARTYRGLQLSYTVDAPGVGIGHLLQWHQLLRLEGTGIDVYDLGMDMEYKRRWADRVDETFAVLIPAR